MTTKISKENSLELAIFLLQLTEVKFRNSKQIKALNKPEIRNWQNFFHSALNCYLPPRCIKCNETHESGKCSHNQVPINEREKLYCVLCNKYGHPASYKGCEKYKLLQQKLRD